MEIINLAILNESQKLSLNSIPDNIINLLKNLTVEQQLECMYVRKADYSGIAILVDSDPSQYYGLTRCCSLSEWSIEKVYVYDGVIIEVLDKKHRLIKFGTIYLENEDITYSYMDSHDHKVYTRTDCIKYRYYLVIHQNHKHLTDITGF